jgi:two-component system CheB/CheR fusion protein
MQRCGCIISVDQYCSVQSISLLHDQPFPYGFVHNFVAKLRAAKGRVSLSVYFNPWITAQKSKGSDDPMANVESPPASENGNNELRFLIVGIGASAGGLEALQEFFAAMPADSGFAFVVVTHQPAGRTSLLPEILARGTSIAVLEATEGITVEPNRVYVSPAGSEIAIAEGVLHLSAPPAKSLHFPVDHFFRSLSFDQREQAVGVVLSGTGSDGTLGVRAIKDAFGMVMVQDEPTARYSGMPSSAQATGLADYVLPPSEMPRQLIRYAEGLAAPGRP